ncbi:uncharacterized protein LTR77_008902 [Saxophila tyrrhenica]|uniref:histidine kinase n=1 Tax=Saxophila tyrrhenica TaxID=1690608 RepID=A0AAV9NYZ0_9PEZI|nr:hypothetical protein LTR77_008902 [Saxophila tyrrhenica]
MSTTTDGTQPRVSVQEREVHRYYQPWLKAQGSSLNVASHVESIGQRELSSRGYQPRSAPDKALLAFAQLAVARLDVKRAMVSLIDPKHQMILAEATRSLSLTASGGLWLGTTVLSRPSAVCEHCFTNKATATNEDGETLTCRGLIVEDCRLDERFKDREYVVQEPGVRFYAGVPIISQSGCAIGAYAVSDEKPRSNGLSVEELAFMQETAAAVMEHLEWARDRVDRFKGERVVRGMASFIEGCSSMDKGDERTATDRVPVSSQPPKEAGSHTTRPQMTSRVSYRRQAFITTQGRRSGSQPRKADGVTRVFHRATEILRESTFADGAVILGASPGASKMRSSGHPRSSSQSSDPTPVSSGPSPGSDSVSHDTSDSDVSPASKPCRVFATAVSNDESGREILKDTSITVGTLERYFQLHPRGKKFYFGEEGSDFTSGEDVASTSLDTESRRLRRNRTLDHRELLAKLPEMKTLIFLPLYDYAEDRLMAGCFLWSSNTGQMMSYDEDLSYLRAFAASIMSEVARINTQQNEAAKTTFIASISHELRSPLHGILGSTELLRETAQDSFQASLLTSISTCGKTLLDTLNHVLDYAKINKLSGRTRPKRSAKHNKSPHASSSDSALESMSITGEVDLGVLVEEVTDAICSGHAFKRVLDIPSKSMSVSAFSNPATFANDTSHRRQQISELDTDLAVSVLLDIAPRQSWLVRTQPGALRRIIMNCLGNALKYTPRGFIAISLRAQEGFRDGKMDTLIRVVDSGKGMSEDFLRDKLFLPFTQEDPYQAGTGLGLSIVKTIVDSLGGSIEVKSQQGIGTEITVRVSLTPAHATPIAAPDEEVMAVAEQTKGMNMVILDPFSSKSEMSLSGRISRLEETLRAVCASWFDMKVSRSSAIDSSDADFYIFAEPPPVEKLIANHHERALKPRPHRNVPVIIICLNAEEAVQVSRHQGQALHELGCHTEVISQPCGPRKLAKVLKYCLQKKQEAEEDSYEATPQDEKADDSAEHPPGRLPESQPSNDNDTQAPARTNESARAPLPHRYKSLTKSLSSAVAFPSPTPLDPTTPGMESGPSETVQSDGVISDDSHVLLVDDNSINLQLLVMFMKKLQFSYTEAENGQEALDHFREACLPGPHSPAPGRRFDVILMDISMPVMDGMEATKRIREFEADNGLEKTLIIALTGLASAQAQEQAMAAGIDVFLPKPVKFAELRKLLVSGS